MQWIYRKCLYYRRLGARSAPFEEAWHSQPVRSGRRRRAAKVRCTPMLPRYCDCGVHLMFVVTTATLFGATVRSQVQVSYCDL